jgi:CelD/BcsL family acetyltransferase involved in cellulose biosynthesis
VPPTELDTAPRDMRAAAQTRTEVIALSDLSSADRVAWRELLATRPTSAPFLDEAWVAAWTHAYGPEEPLVVCAWENGRLVGIGALSEAPRRTIQSLTNLESSRYEFLAADGRADVQERLVRALCEAGRWDVVSLDRLPEGSPTLHAALRVAGALDWRHVVDLALTSPWRALPRHPMPWDVDLKRKFKSNLRNRERRLEALGDVTFTVVRAAAAQREALETFYRLEASGWKGESGTAIVRDASTKTFYDDLHRRTTDDTWIPMLSVAGRPVAAQWIRVHERTLFLLKTAYDPEFAPYAPGQLLTARVMRYGIDQGMEVLDFLGDDMTWKDDWQPQLRPHHRLLLFSTSRRGRLAYWTGHGLREQAKRIPGAAAAVRWLRARGRNGRG